MAGKRVSKKRSPKMGSNETLSTPFMETGRRKHETKLKCRIAYQSSPVSSNNYDITTTTSAKSAQGAMAFMYIKDKHMVKIYEEKLNMRKP